ncbi:MAG: XRE family transcriptional regulator [Nitrospinae bacterium]|nr:XRE family transcriptional regulator [Nitrospinota bacterium]
MKSSRKTGGVKAIRTVFDDLEDDRVAAEKLRIRAELMLVIEKEIKRRKLTQAKAAEAIGVARSRVASLLANEIEKFTIDALVTMYRALGGAVELRLKAPRRAGLKAA